MTTTPFTRNSFIHKHSLALFFILAIILGGGTVYLIVQEVLPSAVALSSVLSASLAGIIMTALEDGCAGLRLMFKRLLIWRVGIGYWLFALLFLLPVVLLGSLANPLFNGDPISMGNIKPAFAILPMFIVFVVVAGVGQELGWTGFLMTRLQARYSALVSCVIRAILVVIWHLPLLIYSKLQPATFTDLQYGAWIAQKGFFVAIVAITLLFMLPWTIFYTWVFNNTKGSLLLVAVLHGSEIWLAYWMLRAGIDPNNLDNYWGYGAVLVIIAIFIVIRTGTQNLSRKHRRIVRQPTSG